jgi:flagellar protein FlgJ
MLNQNPWRMADVKNPLMTGEKAPRSISFDKSTTGTDPVRLKKVCQAFESLFVAQLMKEMRETVPKNDLFDGGHGEEIYTSLLDEKFSEEIAANGSLGLAKKLYESLSEHLAGSKP